MIERLPQSFNLQDRYDFMCVVCSHEMQFGPSIMMQMGMNSGHGRCSKCNTFLHLYIDLSTNEGASQKWEERNDRRT